MKSTKRRRSTRCRKRSRSGHYFVTYEGLPTDWYLKLTGAATRMIRGETPLSEKIPETLTTAPQKRRDYRFDATISRDVLENYLSRSISMEGLLNGRGDLDDNIRMLKSTGAKFIGRSLCLWAGEGNLAAQSRASETTGAESTSGRSGNGSAGMYL